MVLAGCRFRGAAKDGRRGFTLLELTLAVALFTIVMGVTAQSLVSFYATMDMQNQRIVALHHCRTLLSQMRVFRDANPNTPTLPTNFVTQALAQFPPGQDRTGPVQLKNAVARFSYESTNPATANPLVATVTVTWRDLRNRPMTASLTSALTDR
jgi:prepilin-type N-terminal cleavage/methylation domain-containing protein